MDLKNHILLSGRPASGKTQMLIAYANMYPATTLFISQELTNEAMRKRGLSDLVDYKDSFEDIDFEKYKTLCIDYLELFEKENLKQFIVRAIEKDKRIILASQMRRDGRIRNIFEEISKIRE